MFDLGFIGCGNMAGAIIRGLNKNGKISIAATDVKTAAVEALGVRCFADSAELAKNCQTILIAVKPFHAEEVFNQIKDCLTDDQIVISIMAGYKIASIKRFLPVKKIVRVMPNLAAKQLSAMSGLVFDGEFSEQERAFVFEIFEAVGKAVIVTEKDLDAVTAVSGSGTAYVYEFIKHMIKGGVLCGLSEEIAKVLTLQTVAGAVKMVEASDTEIDPMIDAVCSKGGTTIEAIKTLRARGFGETVEEAVKACYDRSVEMGKGN